MNPTDPPFDFAKLMEQAQKLQEDLARTQEDARKLVVEAQSGGGMVVAKMNGGFELVALTIDKQCVDPRDVGMLQDLIIAAVNQAVRKAQEVVQGEMGKLAGGMGIPGLPPGMF